MGHLIRNTSMSLTIFSIRTVSKVKSCFCRRFQGHWCSPKWDALYILHIFCRAYSTCMIEFRPRALRMKNIHICYMNNYVNCKYFRKRVQRHPTNFLPSLPLFYRLRSVIVIAVVNRSPNHRLTVSMNRKNYGILCKQEQALTATSNPSKNKYNSYRSWMVGF